MPATFESFGIRFLYPDNWKEIERPEDEGHDGVTLEMPTGGFFNLEKDHEGQLAEEIIEEIVTSMAEEYGEMEQEDIELTGASQHERAVDFRFYCLDLVVVSRLIIMMAGGNTLILQIQAESREFDDNELVFTALLKQIRDLL